MERGSGGAGRPRHCNVLGVGATMSGSINRGGSFPGHHPSRRIVDIRFAFALERFHPVDPQISARSSCTACPGNQSQCPRRFLRDYEQLPGCGGEFEYRIKSVNEPHERVVRESELQGVWSAYPGGPAAISYRPDPIMIVAAPSLVVELAYARLPFCRSSS